MDDGPGGLLIDSTTIEMEVPDRTPERKPENTWKHMEIL